MMTLLERLADVAVFDTKRRSSLALPGLSEPDRQVFELVFSELSRLLNTRTSPSTGTKRSLSVLDYGISDWSASCALSEPDRQRIARDVQRAFRHFEPRLSEVQVVVLSAPEDNRFTVALGISGVLRTPTSPKINLVASMSAREAVAIHG